MSTAGPCGCGGARWEHRPTGRANQECCSHLGFSGAENLDPLCPCLRFAESYRGQPMNAVSSSNLDAIGYSGRGRQLIVRFKGGGVYGYANVPRTLYDEFLALAREGGSVGAFLDRRVKKAGYRFEKLAAE